jgi:hypothetical protein
MDTEILATKKPFLTKGCIACYYLLQVRLELTPRVDPDWILSPFLRVFAELNTSPKLFI